MKGFILTVAALLTLLPLCQGQEELVPNGPFRDIYWDRDKLAPWRWVMTRGMLVIQRTTDKSIDKLKVESPGGTREVSTPEPVTNVVPSSMDTLPPSSAFAAGVVISPAYTYFAFTDAGKVLQLDLEPPAGALARSLSTNEFLKLGVTSPGNTYLYAASTGNSAGFNPSLQIIDLTTFQTAGAIPLPNTSIPSAIAMTPGGKYLYVAGALRAQTFTDPSGVDCHIIDVASRTIVKTLHFLGSLPQPEILASPDGGRVFLTVPDGVAVIDVLTQSVSHTIPQLSFFGTLHIAINPTGSSLFLAPVRGGGQSGVDVYDLSTSAKVRSIPIPDLDTMSMGVTADGAFLVIDHIVTNPATGLNDFPSLEFISLPSGKLLLTKPYSGSRSEPLTVGGVIPTIIPGP